MTEKLNECFASVFTTEDAGLKTPELTFRGRETEELSQIDVIKDELLEVINTVKK